jgi:hypothetical protein
MKTAPAPVATRMYLEVTDSFSPVETFSTCTVFLSSRLARPSNVFTLDSRFLYTPLRRVISRVCPKDGLRSGLRGANEYAERVSGPTLERPHLGQQVLYMPFRRVISQVCPKRRLKGWFEGVKNEVLELFLVQPSDAFTFKKKFLCTPLRRIISWVCPRDGVKAGLRGLNEYARTVSGPTLGRFYLEEEVLVNTIKEGDLPGLAETNARTVSKSWKNKKRIFN